MRLEGWELRHAEHIEQSQTRTFKWGELDCAKWCCEWILLATGIDLYASWRGKYKTKATASTLMKKRGYASVQDIASDNLPEIPVLIARRGDITLHPEGALGICLGTNSAFIFNDQGLVQIPTGTCLKAWRVD